MIDDEENEKEVVLKGDKEEEVDLMIQWDLADTSELKSQITMEPNKDK